jgi:UDP-glucose 4-epimerase
MLANDMVRVSGKTESVYPELKRFFSGRPVLVDGADGFLGRSCVRILDGLGAGISTLSRRGISPGNQVNRRFEGELTDPDFARAAVEGQSVVLDCIGRSGAVASNRDPGSNLRDECLPHLNLFEACAESGSLPTVVFLSSRLVYGRPVYLPVDESHPLQVESFYAAHKLNVENYLKVYAHTHGLPFVVLRLSNPYGPYRPAAGRDYGIINRFINDALKGRTIRVYGDGSQLRDYIYIEDAVIAMLSTAMVDACHGEIFNLGGPEALSIRDAVDRIRELCPEPNEVKFVPWPAEALQVETGDYWTDFEKLRGLVDLPKQTGFGEGVRRTFNQLREYP